MKTFEFPIISVLSNPLQKLECEGSMDSGRRTRRRVLTLRAADERVILVTLRWGRDLAGQSWGPYSAAGLPAGVFTPGR